MLRKEIKEVQSICKKVGFLAVILMLTAILPLAVSSAFANSSKGQTKIVNTRTVAGKINLVDKYQDKYFEIIKRNNVLLNTEDSIELNNDRKELDDLFAEVEKQITNRSYLRKYKKIQKQFSNCDAETTIGINEFADKNYKAVNSLLNSVYKKAKSKIGSKDLNNFVLSEHKWFQEIEDYSKVYNSMELGTLGASIYYSYQINMKEFRTLLLMLYL